MLRGWSIVAVVVLPLGCTAARSPTSSTPSSLSERTPPRQAIDVAATSSGLCEVSPAGALTCTSFKDGTARSLPGEYVAVQTMNDDLVCAATAGMVIVWDGREPVPQNVLVNAEAGDRRLVAGSGGCCNGIECLTRDADYTLPQVAGAAYEDGFARVDRSRVAIYTIKGPGWRQWRLNGNEDGAYVDVAASRSTVCALSSRGYVDCWGDAYSGGRGLGHPFDVYKVAENVDTWTATRLVACARSEAGNVDCWGMHLAPAWRPTRLRSKSSGSLEVVPTGICVDSICATPKTPLTLQDNIALGGDPEYGCTLVDSRLACEIGKVSIRNVSEYAGAADFGCAALVDGEVVCWRFLHPPVRVSELQGLAELKAVGLNVCGRRRGEVYCVASGPTRLSQWSAASRARISERIESLRASLGHFCALGASGNLYCWGNNQSEAICTGPLRTVSLPQRLGQFSPSASVELSKGLTCAMNPGERPTCFGACRHAPGANVQCQDAPECTVLR